MVSMTKVLLLWICGEGFLSNSTCYLLSPCKCDTLNIELTASLYVYSLDISFMFMFGESLLPLGGTYIYMIQMIRID